MSPSSKAVLIARASTIVVMNSSTTRNSSADGTPLARSSARLMDSALPAALRVVLAEQRAENPMQLVGCARAQQHAMQKLGLPFGACALAGALAQAKVDDD